MFRHEMIFAVPGPGRKVPLPVPGIGLLFDGGAAIERTLAVERLITSGDLVVDEKKTKALSAPPAAPASDAAVTAKKEG